MTTNLARQSAPENDELARKEQELATLMAELAERELDRIAVLAELRAFELRYAREVGSRYADFDDLLAEIAERRARQSPHDPALQVDASEARSQAQDSHETASQIDSDSSIAQAPPPEALKKLFREVAKLVHPDLSTSEAERIRRTRLMMQVNDAYERGDESSLRSILADYEASPESVVGGGAGAELIRVIRKIAQVHARLLAIKAEMLEVASSPLFELKRRVEDQQAAGHDLLGEMAAEIDARMVRARTDLSSYGAV